jgi:hypothetical protein
VKSRGDQLVDELRAEGKTNAEIAAALRSEAELFKLEANVLDPLDVRELSVHFKNLVDAVVKATDHVSEAMAIVEDGDDDGTIRECLAAVNLALWRVRWEAYQGGGEVDASEQPEDVELEVQP